MTGEQIFVSVVIFAAGFMFAIYIFQINWKKKIMHLFQSESEGILREKKGKYSISNTLLSSISKEKEENNL